MITSDVPARSTALRGRDRHGSCCPRPQATAVANHVLGQTTRTHPGLPIGGVIAGASLSAATRF